MTVAEKFERRALSWIRNRLRLRLRRRHELKTWPAPFEAVHEGEKKHEIRRDDRGFKVGDVLLLREYVPAPEGELRTDAPGYTDRWIAAEVTHICRGPSWGIPDGIVVMSIDLLDYST